MIRRRDILQLAAQRQERERQAGVKIFSGAFSGNYPFEGDVSLEFYFYFSKNGAAAQNLPTVFSNYYGITIFNNKRDGVTPSEWGAQSYLESPNVGIRFSLSDGWHQVIFVLKGLISTLYVDGNPAGTMTFKVYPFAGSSFVIGTFYPSNPIAPSRTYEEPITHSRLFNYALSAAEVAALYNGGRPEEYVLPWYFKRPEQSFALDIASAELTRNEGMSVADGVVRYVNTNSAHPLLWGYGSLGALPTEILKERCRGLFEITVEYTTSHDVPLHIAFAPSSQVCNQPVHDVRLLKNGGAAIFLLFYDGTALPNYGYPSFLNGWLYRTNAVNIPEGELDLRITAVRIKVCRACIAEYLPQNITPDTWLDSARQLPMNDEYLPPLLESAGGYDLEANGVPEIIYKS